MNKSELLNISTYISLKMMMIINLFQQIFFPKAEIAFLDYVGAPHCQSDAVLAGLRKICLASAGKIFGHAGWQINIKL